MKTHLLNLFSLSLCLIFTQCSTYTPTDRIQANQAAFYNLPLWEQEKVRAGEVSSGMSPEAVRIAWGNPTSTASQGKKGTYEQVWTWSVQQAITETPPPVFMNGYYYGRRGYYYPGVYAAYPYTSYISVPVAKVTFKNNKVISWEKQNNIGIP